MTKVAFQVKQIIIILFIDAIVCVCTLHLQKGKHL